MNALVSVARVSKRFGPTLALDDVSFELAAGETRMWFVLSALTVGVGFGSAYPAHAAFVLHYVDERRRAAALGGILAALDTGIGTGSMTIGWIIQHAGYRAAYGAAAIIGLFAAPWFLLVAPRVIVLGRRRASQLVASESSRP